MSPFRGFRMQLSNVTSSNPECSRESSGPAARLPHWARISLCVITIFLAAPAFGQPADSGPLEGEFKAQVRPLMEKFCFRCHSTEKHKGDIDLERFTSASEVLANPNDWQKVVEQLGLGEMPPEEKPQPSSGEREKLLAWVYQALDAAALAHEGDPGPVVLRRLNNAEYTFTIRDLTHVESLDPAREFPGDSASGEGFMNTGNSLVMSPAMLTKYLDAAKDIASHAVLLPEGFRFSDKNSRRDWTDELLAEIREFYRRYTDTGGGEKVNLQGIIFDTNQGGRLPIEKYLRVMISEREQLERGGQFAAIAQAHGLSPKYLEGLWNRLNTSQPSLLIDDLRARWRKPKPDEAAMLADIQQWQKALWKFSSVGHIGKAGGPKAWMEPVDPISTNETIRLKLPAPASGSDVVVYLSASDAGDGSTNDIVVWRQPRLILPGRAPLLLRDARGWISQAAAARQRLFASAAAALDAASEAGDAPGDSDIAALAAKHNLRAEDLSAWLNCLGIGASAPLSLDYLTNQIHSSGGYEFVQGWGTAATPLLVANSSTQHVRIPGNMKAHGLAMHPSPSRNIAAGWRSPVSGTMRVKAQVTHAHPECGNGVEWFLELRHGKSRERLARGFAQGSTPIQVGPIDSVVVMKGDLLSLIIGPRDKDHSCDLTDVKFVITDTAANREWNLTRDTSSDILAGNPHADKLGGAATWHFYTEEPSAAPSGPAIPAGSLLAKWRALPSGAEKHDTAKLLQELLLAGMPADSTSPDAALYRQLSSLSGPLLASITPDSKDSEPLPGISESKWSLDPGAFGKLPNGAPIDAASLAVHAPSVLEIHLPAEIAAGSELVVDGALAPGAGDEGTVQLLATLTRPQLETGLLTSETKISIKGGMWTSDNRLVSYDVPIIANEGTAARRRIQSALDEFRQWFPPALCYTKIVPVDEVVTLTLFYREDEHLRRLMLNEAETATIDRLWAELHFVSQDALKLVDVFEQIWQYATQDADPKVFEPMRKPINDAAAAYRKQLVDTEPLQLDALLAFAGRAYRRPLLTAEKEELRELYRGLREKELSHEEAFRATLARVFVSPAFLYRLEEAAPGAEPGPVSDFELATRLSYFLWSSTPDQELLDLAAAGQLHYEDNLARQARRMLKDPRTRRLATEFACAWLHIHDFDSLDEKSERHFPTFTGLRGEMYEEAIRFFADLFERDGSLLDIFDADYTFLNEDLARHYGIPGVTGPEWRRVDGVRKYSRGGILGFAAILSKEAGASRTSPILRGNWVAETLLGDKLPRPPKGVPLLPADEADQKLSVRQLVEQHSKNPMCYGCHQRIDGYGYALESFDAIGRFRAKDMGGRPIVTESTLFDRTQVDGFVGLKNYLVSKKRDVMVRQFCRKLLGYSLGRGVILSDKPLITEMEKQLRQHDYRFTAAVETIVRSKQFRMIRGIKNSEELAQYSHE